MFEKPMAIDESVSAVDTPVRVDLNVCKVGFSVLNTQVNDTLTGYESACKVESSEAAEAGYDPFTQRWTQSQNYYTTKGNVVEGNTGANIEADATKAEEGSC
jgi:hypothetical protein